MKRLRMWLNTPLKPRTRWALVINLVAGVANGYGAKVREERVKKLEARIAALEAENRRQKADLR